MLSEERGEGKGLGHTSVAPRPGVGGEGRLPVRCSNAYNSALGARNAVAEAVGALRPDSREPHAVPAGKREARLAPHSIP